MFHNTPSAGLLLPSVHRVLLSSPCKLCSPRSISTISTRPVPLAAASLAGSPEHFLSFASSSESTPLILARPSGPSESNSSRSAGLLRALRNGDDRLVDVELGRYDDTAPGAFDRMPMRLGQYLDWLESNGGSGGKVGGQQVYLAQWRGTDEIPAVKQLVRPPPILEPLLSGNHADLYQTSFFVGPTGAITPLHYDPYMNLYHLHASSDPLTHAKHLTLLPPSVSEFVRRADGHASLRNTSAIDLQLRPRSGGSNLQFDILTDSCPTRLVDALSLTALSCVLREGETLFIPRGWWHRVENVLLPGRGPSSASAGWTAGIGWWFLLRQP
ncbi:hypothetical protein SCP_0603350 [Sparassis crispa]|uniref:JmjC domain-containing protein n=1 Tax=Sparassis crispa TaxID=139825 RepID=A0A401GQ58_9APHY|nr:hypothetical protein SCP_0603350 [Sparassis crispa]GBE84356.1 hypothetical protein SCP_0603350 [Sparassis crispa]